MILADTSVWVDHFRRGLPALEWLLEQQAVLGHPWVTGELALGNLGDRWRTLRLMQQLPTVPVATADEVLLFVEHHQLYAQGIGYVDVQLLASVKLSGEARVWTRDRRLATAASGLGLAVDEEQILA